MCSIAKCGHGVGVGGREGERESESRERGGREEERESRGRREGGRERGERT